MRTFAKRKVAALLVAACVCACVRSTLGDADRDVNVPDGSLLPDGDDVNTTTRDAVDDHPDVQVDASTDVGPDTRALPASLSVRFLGVQGFALRVGSDVVLTAPLFTRPSVIDVTLGRISPDIPAIVRGLSSIALADLRAIVSGHAHYDHLLDVPAVMQMAPRATLYANRTARHILAAYAPDRSTMCTSAPAAMPIERARTVALDDAVASMVDYRSCPMQRPAGASLEGNWATVPGARVRVRAICSMHPDQIWFIHFGAGSLDAEVCEPPPRAPDWREGSTVAFLIDFLDPTGRPQFRVYYQDAPTDGPVGYVPAELLAEKAVDVALLCVGNFAAVRNHPTEILAAMRPRFAISGHWEDFFVPEGTPPRALPFHDVGLYTRRAETALPPPSDSPVQVSGRTDSARHYLAQPGNEFIVQASR